MKNLVGNNEKYFFLNQGAVTAEVHTSLINSLNNRKREKSIRNQPLIHATLIKIVMNITGRNQIHALHVDRMTISS